MTSQKSKLNTSVPEMLLSLTSKNSCPKTHAGNISLLYLIPFCFRYAIFELEYPTSDGRVESKILFILYAPDIVDSREKFVYATTKDEVRKKVQPFNKEFQVNDWADLDDESFQKVLKH